jgi:hypothetical protein
VEGVEGSSWLLTGDASEEEAKKQSELRSSSPLVLHFMNQLTIRLYVFPYDMKRQLKDGMNLALTIDTLGGCERGADGGRLMSYSVSVWEVSI